MSRVNIISRPFTMIKKEMFSETLKSAFSDFTAMVLMNKYGRQQSYISHKLNLNSYYYALPVTVFACHNLQLLDFQVDPNRIYIYIRRVRIIWTMGFGLWLTLNRN